MKIMLWALHFAEYANLLAAALQRNAEVMLVVYADNARNELGPDFRSLISRTGVQLVVLDRPRTPFDVLRNVWRLTRAVKLFSPDVVHIQEDGRDEMVLALPALAGLPVVLTVHDPAPHSGRDAKRYRFARVRLYHALLRRRADRAITHGKRLAESLVRVTPWLAGRIHAIAHGPLGLLQEHPSPRLEPGSPARLLFFGRIHAYKGLQYFIEAVTALHQSGMNVTGVIAGRGTDLDKYRTSITAAGCFELLERYIPSDEVAELFGNTDVVVLPYTDATQSGVAAMALGYGIPVVATSVGSIPEFVRDGVNGQLVAPRDSTAVADAVRQILQEPGKFARLVQSALVLRDGELSWSTIADQTMDCYKAAAKK